MAMSVLIDDYDIQTNLGVVVTDAPNWRSSPTTNVSMYDMPGRSGSLMGTSVVSKPRDLSFTVFYRASSVSDRRTKEDSLKRTLGGSLKKITFNDGVNAARIVWGAMFSAPEVRMIGHYGLATVFSMTCTFTCPNGFWSDEYWSSVALPAAATAYQVPLGTYTSPWILNIMGAATGPFTVTVKRTGGQTLYSMTFSGSLTSSEWLSIDSVNRKIEKVSGGVRTSWAGSSNWTAGEWPVLDPIDGNYALGAGPTVETSAGTGELLYLKRYR